MDPKILIPTSENKNLLSLIETLLGCYRDGALVMEDVHSHQTYDYDSAVRLLHAACLADDTAGTPVTDANLHIWQKRLYTAIDLHVYQAVGTDDKGHTVCALLYTPVAVGTPKQGQPV